ncbi:N-glycosylase/DNA lyase [archaeon]|jgi:N-glycosylase/DNA lyase|nr:N-glycosylase/DNA lyase [archaeon]MBT4022830.1 N-glycosylase/DNA lyase [archaeon]MBT4272976.1 N-glycosylase/DNA lyase [archaeon]MBT4460933.1 N-glycosylase/DNA lyase [archaeon]MBT4858039.1 N-glycosylase/DNA lyase [archaeon]
MKNQLYNLYKLRKQRILCRLNEFKTFFSNNVCWNFTDNNIVLVESKKNHNERLFEELSFCLLTANTSAAMSAKSIDNLRPILEVGNLEKLQRKLNESGYRFPNIRAKYIIEARDKKLNLKELVLSNEKFKLREFLALNVKGLGFKESSHFLRNIGVFGLSILDKHIIRSMQEFGVIGQIPKTITQKNYLDLEKKYFQLSRNLKINSDELDLLLWSMKNGQILK